MEAAPTAAARPVAAVAEPELPKGSPSPRAKPTPVAAATPVRAPAGGVADGEPASPASPAAEAPTSPPPPGARMSPVPPARPTAAARPGGLRKVAEPGAQAGAGLTAVNQTDADPKDAKLTPVASELAAAAAAVPKRPPSAKRPQSALTCPICLDTVAEGEGRSTAALACGHKFHLSCIGSAFNAKGAMVCPLCRREEDEEWRYADGLRAEDDWDPADLGEADAALFYPSEDEYDYEQDDPEYWCEELPVLWRIHAAPLRYSGDLTDEEEYDDDEDLDEEEGDAVGDEDDVGDDELDDDASIDEDFHAHYAEDDEYAGARRQVFLRGRPMIVHQYVELSHVYDDRGAEGDELDDSSSAAAALESAPRAVRGADATPTATSEGDPAAATAGLTTVSPGDGSADPVPEEEVADLAPDAASEGTETERETERHTETDAERARTGGASEVDTRAMAGAGHAPSLRLRRRQVLHFGRVLSYGAPLAQYDTRWSDLSFDSVDGSVALGRARYCYVANLELGLLPAER